MIEPGSIQQNEGQINSPRGYHPWFAAGSIRRKLFTRRTRRRINSPWWFFSKSNRVTQSTLRPGWLRVVLQRRVQLRSASPWFVRCVDESSSWMCHYTNIGCEQYLEGTLLQYDSASPALLRGSGRPHVLLPLRGWSLYFLTPSVLTRYIRKGRELLR